MKDKQDFQKTRQYHRIRYPLSYRPQVRIKGEDCNNDVVELSERGVRFIYKGTRQLSKGLEMQVNIIFYDGESFQFTGEILRVEKKDVILHFSVDLPITRIMKEQRYLRAHIVGYM